MGGNRSHLTQPLRLSQTGMSAPLKADHRAGCAYTLQPAVAAYCRYSPELRLGRSRGQSHHRDRSARQNDVCQGGVAGIGRCFREYTRVFWRDTVPYVRLWSTVGPCIRWRSKRIYPFTGVAFVDSGAILSVDFPHRGPWNDFLAGITAQRTSRHQSANCYNHPTFPGTSITNHRGLGV